MNKKGQGEEIIIYAVVFLVLFFIGGIIGLLSLPEFPGRFFFSGLSISVFGIGAGFVVLNVVLRH